MCKTTNVYVQYHDLLSKNKKKKESWRGFCSKRISKTPSQKVWKAIRKIKRKRGSSSIVHLRENDQLLTDKKWIANLLTSNSSKNSSTENYSPCFQKIKKVKNKTRLSFSFDYQEDYYLPFSLTEFKQSLQKSNDSATGLDEIYYQMLTNLTDTSLSTVLQVFNNI